MLGNSELPSDIGRSLEVAKDAWNHTQPLPNMPHVLGNSELPSEWSALAQPCPFAWLMVVRGTKLVQTGTLSSCTSVVSSS